MGFSSEMKDTGKAVFLKKRSDQILVEDVAMDELAARVAESVLQIFSSTGVSEGI